MKSTIDTLLDLYFEGSPKKPIPNRMFQNNGVYKARMKKQVFMLLPDSVNFTDRTTLNFHLERPSLVSLVIYNPADCMMVSLICGFRGAGTHRVTFDARSFPEGLYVARLRTQEGLAKVYLYKTK